MSTYTSEPGTRLAGRYRLVDQVTAGNGWTMWKAIDETLARPVSVLTFASGFPRIAQVVTAARAASRLTDPRMAQVFDVEDGGGQAYVVLEWVSGETLTDMLTDGPLDPGRACSLISEAARALAGAHAVGQAHLRLTPDALCWTRSSGIKITGLGIDAALAGDGLTGTDGHDPAIADTIALAGLLYAALTGYWPGRAAGPAARRPRLRRGGLHPAPGLGRRLLGHRQRDRPGPVAADDQAGTADPVPGRVRGRHRRRRAAGAAPRARAPGAGRTPSAATRTGAVTAATRPTRTTPTPGRPAGQGGTAPYPERRQSAQCPSAGRGYQPARTRRARVGG